MCNLIFTICPTCRKVAAPSRVRKCVERSSATGTSCQTHETKIMAMNPCAKCSKLTEPSNPTRAQTRDILEEMSLKIPESRPILPPKIPLLAENLPDWNPETLALVQSDELFLEHITRQHSVQVKNRQGLPSQRTGLPLCLVAGMKQHPARVYQQLPKFASPRTPGRERATIALPPSAWNNHRRISRLGVAPEPRSTSFHAGSAPTRTPTCLVPEGIRRRSRLEQESSAVLPVIPEALRIRIPSEASASTQYQDTKTIPSSATSAHSEFLLPGPSPQVDTFSAVAFASIPAHYDMRPASIPAPLRAPTPQQRNEERERRETLDYIEKRMQERQEEERSRLRLETERIREFQQREDTRSRSEATPSRTIHDVQFQSVRPLQSKRSLKILPRLRSFSPIRRPHA